MQAVPGSPLRIAAEEQSQNPLVHPNLVIVSVLHTVLVSVQSELDAQASLSVKNKQIMTGLEGNGQIYLS